ncbi:hypothetical protein J2T12_000998 [Paenibacillus anaericanus]|uniref:hypothetical protein n=1 Tax=Paenibacillus anaericanus TaxID=170367 RepID=UPI00278AE088|nr:hypothetical protein [Paenibacillus anaericanus]MDQ0087604.1 hypothetical protein [Paenibacillus anaericanus]
MMSVEKNLKSTTGDIGHKFVKASLSSVPVAGSFLSELFTTIVAEPSSRRRDQILIEIDNRLIEMSNKIEQFDINKLSSNEVFLSTVSQAYQIAMRSHQEEKLQALLNAISNSVVSDLDDNLQHMFLMMIDSFTEWHIRILLLIDNPQKTLESMQNPTNFGMGSLSQLVLSAYPELRGRDEVLKQIWKDLYNNGLTNTSDQNIKAMISGHGMLDSRTSDLGKTFIKFITINY